MKLKNKYIVFMYLSMFFFGVCVAGGGGRGCLQGELDNPIPGNKTEYHGPGMVN